MNRREFVAGTAALVLAPRAFARAQAAPVVLVTADEQSRVVAVDLASGRVLRHIRTPAGPRSIETVGEVAVVAHTELGALSLVRGARVRVLRGLDEPRYTAAHPDGRHAYVTDAARGEVVAIDVVRARIIARERVGLHARHVTISSGGRTLWIALGSKAEEIAIVDVSTPPRPRLLRTIHPPFLAHDVAWSPDARRVWVSSGDRRELAVYDARSGRIVARPEGDWPPQHVTFAGKRAYVTSGWSGTVRVHGAGGDELRSNPVPVGSYNVQAAAGRVVTPSLGRGTLTVLDAAGDTLYRVQVARSSHDACIV